jgi:hypothetical protein
MARSTPANSLWSQSEHDPYLANAFHEKAGYSLFHGSWART